MSALDKATRSTAYELLEVLPADLKMWHEVYIFGRTAHSKLPAPICESVQRLISLQTVKSVF